MVYLPRPLFSSMHFMNTPQWSDILIQIRVLYAILRITYLFHGILIWFPILYILFWRMLWTWSSLMTIRDGLAALTCWRGYGCHRRRETESGCLLKPPTGQVPHFVSHEPVKRLLWWIPHQKLRERFAWTCTESYSCYSTAVQQRGGCCSDDMCPSHPVRLAARIQQSRA